MRFDGAQLFWTGLVIRFEVKTRLFTSSRHFEVKLEDEEKDFIQSQRCLYVIAVVLFSLKVN